MPSPNLIAVRTLDGIRIHYDRFRPEDYGQPGHPHTVYMTKKTHRQLDAFASELFAVAKKSVGDAKFIMTAGAYVQKPGYHGQGRAFDLDALVFEDYHWIADSFPRDPQMYLAIEAIVRKHFGTVLTYSYNDPHKDHIHMDNGTDTGFNKMSRSRVIFLQNAIYFVYGLKVGRDGVWGPETSEAEKRVREMLGIGGLGNKANWLAFLDTTAKQAFGIVKQRDQLVA